MWKVGCIVALTSVLTHNLMALGNLLFLEDILPINKSALSGALAVVLPKQVATNNIVF